jgi:hypothetical protein
LAISIEERRACILDFSPIRESYEELSEIGLVRGERKDYVPKHCDEANELPRSKLRALEKRDENYSKGVHP